MFEGQIRFFKTHWAERGRQNAVSSTELVEHVLEARIVGLLLHLSDLHLADADGHGEVTGDYKTNALPLADRQRRTKTIRSSLHSLGRALNDSGDTLDAIVISGDVTVQGADGGLELLPSVLGELGDALPAPSQILIVPGNHDVKWNTAAGTPERYTTFLKLREYGYKTALLEGIDLFEDVVGEDSTPPFVVAPDKSFVVAGINSSNHCGVQTEVEADLQQYLDQLEDLTSEETPTGLAVGSLLSAWRARGLFDIARVDSGQRLALNEMLLAVLSELRETGNNPVVLAALHHQIRPVGDSEEFKPFEGITNLGEFREWLASNDVDIVLHGHKHESRVIQDVFVPFERHHAETPHRLLVVSAPTIGHGQPGTGPVARLIRFSPQMPRIADVEITLIPSRRAGVSTDLATLSVSRHKVGGDDPERTGVLDGETAQDVHDLLLALQDNLTSIPTPLICRIQDGKTALSLPHNYPDIGFDSTSSEEGAIDRGTWLREMVNWWQRPNKGSAAPFNHGERIRRYDNGSVDQFERAIKALVADQNTSRAIVILIDPVEDFKRADQPFPAFTLVQLLIKSGRLNLTAYFRKQEMPHWWPINVAELATLQEAAVEQLRQKQRTVTPGSICTVTSIPVAGDAAPRVVVPSLDFRAEDPAGMLDLLLPLFFPTGKARDEVVSSWLKIVDDWRPGERMAADGDPVPVLGVQSLHSIAVSMLAISEPADDQLGGARTQFVQDLHELAEANQRYAVGQQSEDRATRHAEWRARVDELLERMFDTLRVLVAKDGEK